MHRIQPIVVVLGLAALLLIGALIRWDSKSAPIPAPEHEPARGAEPTLAVERADPGDRSQAAMPGDTAGVATDAAVMEPDRPQVVREVRGRVTNGLGTAAAGVSVFLLQEDAVLAEAITSEAGRFRMTVRQTGTLTVRALVLGCFSAEADRTLDVQEHTRVYEVELAFPASNALVGRLTWPSGAPAPGVLVKLAPAVDGSTGPWHRIPWFGERSGLWAACESATPDSPWVGSRTTAEGRFGFMGLEQGVRHAVWWLGDDGRAVRHPEDVIAGQTGLVVVADQHRLRLEFIDADTGGPVRPRISMVRADGTPLRPAPGSVERSAFSAEHDELDVVGRPGTVRRVIAYHERYALSDTTHTIGKEGHITPACVVLEPLPSPVRLRVETLGPEGEREPAPLRFSYLAPDGAVIAVRPHAARGDQGSIVRELSGCRVRIATADPDEGAVRRSARQFLHAVVDVDLPTAGDTMATLRRSRGGQLRIQFVDREGRPLAAADPSRLAAKLAAGGDFESYWFDYTLVDARGAPHRVLWWYGDEELPPTGLLSQSDGAALSTAIAPGSYELHLGPRSRGSRLPTVTHGVRIRPGEISLIEVEVDRSAGK